MKRTILFVICVLMMVTLLTAPVSAAGSAQMTITPSTGSPTRSDTVVFTVSVSSISNCKALGIVINYDTAYFEWVSGECLIDAAMKDFSNGTATMAFDAKNVSGNVFRFTLRVKANAKFGGTTAVSGTGSARDTEGTVSIGVTAASVTIACNHNYGAWNNAGSSHTRTCTICGNVETKAHTYDNGCDKYCNQCNAVRETTHKFSTNWSSNADYHWHECTVCGDWADDARHTPGDPATETTAQTCTVCGYEIVPAIGHTHQTDGVWLSDETGHWQNCETCEEKAYYTPHDYAADCDSICDTCEYEREVVHTPGEEWSANGEQHWHACAVCGVALDMAEHEADLTAEHPVCSICGAAVTHVHSYDAWGGDESRHWHECSCGDRQGVTLHRWDDGQVSQTSESDIYGQVVFTCTVCEATKTALAVGAGTQQNMLFWYITCGVLAVALIAAVTVIVVFIVKMNKKPAGKYAGAR